MEYILSQHNNLLKLASSLRTKKNRDECGLFVVEGVRLVEETVQANWEIEAILGTEKAYNQIRVCQIVSKLSAQNCRIIVLSEALYQKISDTEQPQGLLAIVRKRTIKLGEWSAVDRPLLAILDEVQDPGNVGALIRTADAAGCTAVILTKGCADIFGGKALRATMGSLYHIPIVTEVDIAVLLDWLSSNDIHLAVTALKNANTYFNARLSDAIAIVFGNEGAGVSQRLLDSASQRLYIPIYGKAESLNVAAAAAVIFYEAARQRHLAL